MKWMFTRSGYSREYFRGTYSTGAERTLCSVRRRERPHNRQTPNTFLFRSLCIVFLCLDPRASVHMKAPCPVSWDPSLNWELLLDIYGLCLYVDEHRFQLVRRRIHFCRLWHLQDKSSMRYLLSVGSTFMSERVTVTNSSRCRPWGRRVRGSSGLPVEALSWPVGTQHRHGSVRRWSAQVLDSLYPQLWLVACVEGSTSESWVWLRWLSSRHSRWTSRNTKIIIRSDAVLRRFGKKFQIGL